MPDNTGRNGVSQLECSDFRLFVEGGTPDASPRCEAEQHAVQCEACCVWLDEESTRLDQRIEALTGLPIELVAILAFLPGATTS